MSVVYPVLGVSACVATIESVVCLVLYSGIEQCAFGCNGGYAVWHVELCHILRVTALGAHLVACEHGHRDVLVLEIRCEDELSACTYLQSV